MVERHLAKVHVARSTRVTRLEESLNGKVAEWLNASVLKTDVVARLPGVRIPPFPIQLKQKKVNGVRNCHIIEKVRLQNLRIYSNGNLGYNIVFFLV